MAMASMDERKCSQVKQRLGTDEQRRVGHGKAQTAAPANNGQEPPQRRHGSVAVHARSERGDPDERWR
jgi:hypothetical protein